MIMSVRKCAQYTQHLKGLQKIHGSIVEVVSAGKIFNAGTTKLCLMEGKRYGIKNNKGVYSMQYAW